MAGWRLTTLVCTELQDGGRWGWRMRKTNVFYDGPTARSECVGQRHLRPKRQRPP